MIAFQHENSDDNSTLKLIGPLTIEYATTIKDVLIESIERTDNLSINLDGITEIDLSGLQLLCAAHRTAITNNKSVRLEKNSSEVYNQTVKSSGFFRNIGCTYNDNNNCYWNIGDVS